MRELFFIVIVLAPPHGTCEQVGPCRHTQTFVLQQPAFDSLSKCIDASSLALRFADLMSSRARAAVCDTVDGITAYR